jgi:hypothetical protein
MRATQAFQDSAPCHPKPQSGSCLTVYGEQQRSAAGLLLKISNQDGRLADCLGFRRR